MAQRSKAFFLAKFITNYIVQHQDMTDLADSALFYSDDVGCDTSGAVYIYPLGAPSYYNASSRFLLKLPLLNNPAISDIIANTNNLTSESFSPLLVNLVQLDLSVNNLSSVIIPATLVSLQTIILTTNVLTDFIAQSTWVSLLSVFLNDCALTSLGIEHTLVPLAASGAAVAVDVSGGSNASHATWTAPALAAEITIIANGGSVDFHP